MPTKKMEKVRVVGVGASAGGLEALEAFFKQVPLDTNLSFVVIQHLSPDFKSLMDELLSRYTELRIQKVDREVLIRPNFIYLIPPKKNLSIKNGRLIPTDQDASLQLRLPIDYFFISLAEEFGDKAIGVVLSGTGCDGTRGCAAIREADGFVIVQDPQSCQFDGMPKSVIRQNLQDVTLRPEQMPEAILKYLQKERGDLDLTHLENEPDKLREIITLLQSVEGLDFSDYRPSTIVRRIERRVKLNHFDSLADYIRLINEDKSELRQLHGELLIGVTRFFRDSEDFEALRNSIVPTIVKQAIENKDETIRVWVAGCSTGEEAYSIAICFLEYFHERDISLGLKVFATDVDKEAIEIGARGKYPESIIEDVGPKFIEKYFLKRDAFYEAKAKLRRSIIFSYHNATKDPPFTKMHLISCRNMLIYFQPPLQAKTLSLFHFGLAKKGILFLGKSESLGNLASEFRNIQYKFFEKVRDVKLALANEMGLSRPLVNSRIATQEVKDLYSSRSYGIKEQPANYIYEKLLNKYVPPCLLIDENYELLHIFGNAGRFLDFPVGKSTLSVLKIMDKDLLLALSTAVTRSTKLEEEVLFTNIRSQNFPDRVFNLRVEPFLFKNHHQLKTYLVAFEENREDSPIVKATGESYHSSTHSFEQINNLEEQLQSTKETLQATIEELETTNEELQSTNEELMSSNEELQSSNEELQSVNEELFTVNSEHQSKIEEITQVNYDIDFLLSSSKIATMFLDETLRIKRFNSEIQKIVSVLDHDIGRPITDLTFNIANDLILKLILEVNRTGKTRTEDFEKDGISYLVKCVAYEYKKDEGTGGKVRQRNGVVLSFIDVTSINEIRDLTRLNSEAEEFSTVVSNYLVEPVASLKGFTTELSKNSKAGEKAIRNFLRKNNEVLSDDVDLLERMVAALQRYSELRVAPKIMRKFEVKKVLRDACGNLKELISGAEVTFLDVPETLVGEAKYFEELMAELIVNPFVHNRSRRKLRVEVSAKRKDGFWEFLVEDNGSGIVAQETNKIFDLFQTSLAKSSKKHLGIGLALARRILNRYGGQIWVADSSSKGTKIAFSYPDIHP